MDPSTNDFMRWAFNQGALTVLIIIGGYFYRRDSKDKDAMITTLIALINQSNATQATQSAAIREQAIATAHLSETLTELKDEIRGVLRPSPPRIERRFSTSNPE
jgi:hypothetical protein